MLLPRKVVLKLMVEFFIIFYYVFFFFCIRNLLLLMFYFFIEFDNYETFFVRTLTSSMLNAKFVAFSIPNTKNHISSSVPNVLKKKKKISICVRTLLLIEVYEHQC